MSKKRMPEWQGKKRYSIVASYVFMYIGFLGIVGTILFMLVSNH